MYDLEKWQNVMWEDKFDINWVQCILLRKIILMLKKIYVVITEYTEYNFLKVIAKMQILMIISIITIY